MKAKAWMAASAAIALGGCHLIGTDAAANDSAEAGNVAGTQGSNVAEVQPLGDKRADGGGEGLSQPRSGDAGITNSRSLQVFSNNDGGLPGTPALGGKEPIGPGGGGGGAAIISAQALVGSWADNPDCTMDVTFFADGTFSAFNGGGGNWRLSGNSLTLSGGGGSHRMEILSFDGQIMQVRNPDGSIGRSRRC